MNTVFRQESAEPGRNYIPERAIGTGLHMSKGFKHKGCPAQRPCGTRWRAAVTLAALLCLSAPAAAQDSSSSSAADVSRESGSFVLIVKSGNLPQYDAPVAAFIENSPAPVRQIELLPEAQEASRMLQEFIDKAPPHGVFALGAPAAQLSHKLMPDTPTVFAMVLNWQRFGLTGGPVAGVSAEVPIAARLTRFKLMLPRIKRIGVIYSHATPLRRIETARRAATALGIDLVEEAVVYADEVPGAYRRIRTEIDALWMTPDSIVVSIENFNYLAQRTLHDRIAFLAFSENFVRAGALLSISADHASAGSQAAVLLEKMLADPTLRPEVQDPMGSSLAVNQAVAAAIDMPLDNNTVSMADVIIKTVGGKR